MARTVRDLALAMTVMAGVGYDSRDNTTAAIPPEVVGRDYIAALRGGPELNGLRVGLIRGFFNFTGSSEVTPVNEVMGSMLSRLEAAGVTVVNINEPVYNTVSC